MATTESRQAREGDQRELEELKFLHGVAHLATTARTWEELLSIVVDGTRDALGADVSSLYLLDRDGRGLTLAATNGPGWRAWTCRTIATATRSVPADLTGRGLVSRRGPVLRGRSAGGRSQA